ncbi:MAG: hypothetical protein ACYS7Y_20230 [Planctomycetota bacterium]|jgi:hypothetical protein
MIGYHYTTVEAWMQIEQEGMKLSPMKHGHEWDHLSEALPGLQREVIWVWQEPLTNYQALIIYLLIADAFRAFDIALLKIHYPESASASIVYCPPGDTVKLTCRISAGRMETNPPMDLILDEVDPSDIELLWTGNILRALDGRHKGEHNDRSARERTAAAMC